MLPWQPISAAQPGMHDRAAGKGEERICAYLLLHGAFLLPLEGLDHRHILCRHIYKFSSLSTWAVERLLHFQMGTRQLYLYAQYCT